MEGGEVCAMTGCGEEAEAIGAASASRTACHTAARRCYFAPFFEAGLEAGAFFARAGAFAAAASREPVLKLTRLPAGICRGAPPRMDLIVRAETADNFHDPKPMRRT